MRFRRTSPLQGGGFVPFVDCFIISHLYCFSKMIFYSWYSGLIFFDSSLEGSFLRLGSSDFILMLGSEDFFPYRVGSLFGCWEWDCREGRSLLLYIAWIESDLLKG
jgi:hypothetical protein